MPHVKESIHIDRPVSEVFAYVANPDNQVTIMSNLVEFSSDGPFAKGARASGVTRVAGKKVEWTSEITEYEAERLVEIRSLEAPMDFQITWTYEPDGDGTRLTFEQEAESLGGFFGKLADPVVTKMYARDIRGNLENLKILMEEGGA